MLKGNAPAFFCTSENTARDVFILSWYVTVDSFW